MLGRRAVLLGVRAPCQGLQQLYSRPGLPTNAKRRQGKGGRPGGPAGGDAVPSRHDQVLGGEGNGPEDPTALRGERPIQTGVDPPTVGGRRGHASAGPRARRAQEPAREAGRGGTEPKRDGGGSGPVPFERKNTPPADDKRAAASTKASGNGVGSRAGRTSGGPKLFGAVPEGREHEQLRTGRLNSTWGLITVNFEKKHYYYYLFIIFIFYYFIIFVVVVVVFLLMRYLLYI